jgi:hypothetical protein
MGRTTSIKKASSFNRNRSISRGFIPESVYQSIIHCQDILNVVVLGSYLKGKKVKPIAERKDNEKGDVKKGTSYVAPVKRENENILSFVKTTNYKTVLILGTPLP